MIGSDLAWRIDALDARGGLAFLSYREPDLSNSKTDLDLPGVFVGAPEFQPQSISSRAAALAAGRRAFQLGLFIGGEEVGFDGIESVIEFVRRGYLRGGGGDSAGPGPGGPPPPPGLGPDLPPFPEIPTGEEGPTGEGASISQSFLNDVEKFGLLSLGLKLPSVAAPVDYWTGDGGPAGRTESALSGRRATWSFDGPHILARASLLLISEMLRRLPIDSSEGDFTDWLGKANSLGIAIGRLRLSPLLLHTPYFASLSSCSMR